MLPCHFPQKKGLPFYRFFFPAIFGGVVFFFGGDKMNVKKKKKINLTKKAFGPPKNKPHFFGAVF